MATEARFAVVVPTAPPPGLANEAGGAYVKVDGRESLLRSVELFLSRKDVVLVVLVASAEEMPKVKDRFGPHLSFSGVKLVVGGPRWADQLSAAAAAVPAEATHVAVHDAARPVVPAADVDAVFAAAADHPAVALSTPVRTTLVESDDGGQPMAYVPPQRLAHLLTPQAFDRSTFAEMARGKAEVHASKLMLLRGSPLNVRVGSPADAAMATALLKVMPRPKMSPSASPFEEAQW